MKKAYFAISYSQRKHFNNEIEQLKEVFSQKNIQLFVFVDYYTFKYNEEKKMMETAYKEIESSDYLLAELTTKSIGVGIEIGFAYALKKPILYFKKKDSEYSTTAGGCSTWQIEYENISSLIKKTNELLNTELRD